jgi:hypothetical protein
MKVAFVYLDLDYGGIQRLIQLLVNGFAMKDADDCCVELILLKGGGALLHSLSPKIKVIELGYEGRTSFFMPKMFLPTSPLVQYLQKSNFDVVMSFEINLLLAWIKLLYRFPFRLVLSLHNAFLPCQTPAANQQRTSRSLKPWMAGGEL